MNEPDTTTTALERLLAKADELRTANVSCAGRFTRLREAIRAEAEAEAARQS